MTVMTPSEKKCSMCKEVLAASFFYQHPRMKSGLSSRCKTCHNAAGQKWAQRNKDKRRQVHVASHLKRTYGITVEAYDSLREQQGYSCAICGIHESKAAHGRLCVDHCHSTGNVRGLLCNKCNSAIGLLGDNRATLASAINYLENH